MKKVLFTVLVALFAIGMFSGTAGAVVVLPGAINTPVTGLVPSPGVTTLAHTTTPFTGKDFFNNVLFTGTLDAWVKTSATGLVFEYKFNNDASSLNAITQVAMLNFGGFTTNVDAYPLAGDPFPNGINRSGGTGTTLTFGYLDNSVDPGQISQLLWVQTNAQYFTAGTTQMLGGGVDTLQTFAPTVPEPASMMLLGFSLVGLGARRFRNRKV